MFDKIKKNANRATAFGLALLATALCSVQSASAAAADPTDVIADATAAFDLVTVLVVAMVGFYIIVRIVKGIRK